MMLESQARIQTSVTLFFQQKKKKNAAEDGQIRTVLPYAPSAGFIARPTITTIPSMTVLLPASVATTIHSTLTANPPALTSQSCQGFIPQFRRTNFQLDLEAFCQYGTIDNKSPYKTGKMNVSKHTILSYIAHKVAHTFGFIPTTGVYGECYCMFALECTGTGATIRKDKSFQCPACHNVQTKPQLLSKVKELVRRQGGNLMSACDVVSRMELTSTDYSFMTSFIKIEDKWLSSLGRELKRRVRSQLDFYKQIKSSPLKAEICNITDGKVPCGDTLSQFNKLYLNNVFKILENLVTVLLKDLVIKMMEDMIKQLGTSL